VAGHSYLRDAVANSQAAGRKRAAAQAVEMKDYPISSKLRAYLKAYRKHVSFLDQDRPLQPDFEKTKAFFNEINWFA